MLTVLVLSVAFAEPDAPSAARQCADAAHGTEVEVCLRLATANPDQVDGVAAALKARIDQIETADRDLLDATLLLMSQDRAVEGAVRLAETRDPRVVPPLVQAAETRDEQVALAAIAALSRFPTALPALVTWLTDARRDLAFRLAVVEALGTLEEPQGADAMLAALRRRGMPPLLRQKIISTITAHYPDRTDELARQVTNDGTVWLAMAGGWGLAWPLAAAGHVGVASMAGVGFGTGIIAGATLGWVSGSAWPMEAEDAAFLTSTAVLTTAAGAFAGSALDLGSTRLTGAYIGALIGEGVGYPVGILLRRAHKGHVPDALEATTLATAAAVGAATFTEFAQQPSTLNPPDGVHLPQLAASMGFLVGGIAGHVVAPMVRPVGADGWVIAVGTIVGGTAATLAPLGDLRRYNVPLGGLAVGYLSGYALAAAIDTDRSTLIGALGGLALGGAVGWGAAALLTASDLTESDDTIRGAALVGGAVGLAVGTLVTEANEGPVDPRDVAAATLVTVWGGGQAAGWAAWADLPPGSRGGVLVIPAVAGIGVGLAAPMLDVPLSYTYAAGSLGVWGAYLGGVAGQVVDAETPPLDPRSPSLLLALVGSNVGVVSGIIAGAPLVGMSPLVIGMADGGGVLLGSAAALAAGVAGAETNTVLIASLAGAATGFVTGGLVGTILHRTGRTRDIALVSPTTRLMFGPTVLTGPAGSPAYGGVLEVSGW
jgi:hypothetical protein